MAPRRRCKSRSTNGRRPPRATAASLKPGKGRGKHAEEERDLALAKYHHYELASAAFQIGIVLASATIITGMIALAWISGVLAIVGIAFTAIGPLAAHGVLRGCLAFLHGEPRRMETMCIATILRDAAQERGSSG